MRIGLLIPLILGVTGCGTSTNDLVISPPACKTARSEVELDTKQALDFTASEILAFAEGPLSAPLTWTDPQAVTVFPEPPPSELTVSVESRDGAVVEVDAIDDGCVPHLEIPIITNISSPEGALEERMEAVLSASSSVTAELIVTIPLKMVQGDLRLVAAGEGANVTRLTFLLRMSPTEFSGELLGESDRESAREDGARSHSPSDRPCMSSGDRTLASGEFQLATFP